MSEGKSGFRMDVLEAVPKNSAESFLIGLDEFNGRRLCNVRVGRTCRGWEKILTRDGMHSG